MDVKPVILAAGDSKRMNSGTPKVLHKLLGVCMIDYAVGAVNNLGKPVVVVGRGADQVREHLGDRVSFALQEQRLGTGHAVMCAREFLPQKGYVAVLAGDMPLVTPQTMEGLCQAAQGKGGAVLTAEHQDPAGYGRIIRRGNRVVKIVEHKDASPQELEVREINTSVYCFEAGALHACLDKITTDNAQGEYYLTDVISLMAQMGLEIEAVTAPLEECVGVNDLYQLLQAETLLQRRVNRGHMLGGVRLMDENTRIDPRAVIGRDTVIYPGNVIEGPCVIGGGVTLYPGNFIEDAVIGDRTKIGPNAHLRPKTQTGEGCRVGNFVELKNVVLDDGAKVSHLAYCGDGEIGKKSNISCGVIFSNYDGKVKNRTVVGDNCFVGCNANLVAPVTLGNGCYVAAGSTVTDDVPENALAVARARQVLKPGWAQRRRDG